MCQHISQSKMAHASLPEEDKYTLALLALYLFKPYDTRMLSMAPLLVVLCEERIEGNWVPGNQIDWEYQQI